MSLAAVVQYVRDLLDGTATPFPSADPVIGSALRAFITPPDPYKLTHIPTLYVLSASGPEKRLDMPRNTNGDPSTAGHKTVRHTLELHIICEIASTNPAAPGASDPDLLFTGAMSAVMAALRTSPAPVPITDPFDGTVTSLIDPGEEMQYRYLPRMATKSQRVLRYDGVITLPLLEFIQA